MRCRALERFLRVDRSKVHGLGVFSTVGAGRRTAAARTHY
jgi:hypothetical protein